jgi:FkbM family methyltransferase
MSITQITPFRQVLKAYSALLNINSNLADIRDAISTLKTRDPISAEAPKQPASVPGRTPGENLIEDVRFILGGSAARVVDVGCHFGDTTRRYLDSFPGCKVFAFEAEAANFALAKAALAPYGDRVVLSNTAVSDKTGEIEFHVNSHDGTHSVFPIGEQRYWGGHAVTLGRRKVASVRLDDVLPRTMDGQIDLLHMDIQGGELQALKGATQLLSERRIRLVYAEVSFFPLYEGQPLFWEIGKFLSEHGFRLYSFYDRYYHVNNPRTLSWADALFICDELTEVPENIPNVADKSIAGAPLNAVEAPLRGAPSQPGELGIDLPAITRAPFTPHAERKPPFSFGSITTTEVCNLSCVMCHFNGPNAVKKTKTLDPALIRKAMDELSPGSRVYLGATGEFFVDEFALDHVRYAISRGLVPLILSHGQAYTPDLLDELLRMGVRGFRMSCDAIDAVHYERIRRGGKFQVILDAVAYLNSRRSEFQGLSIEIGCTLFRKTFDQQREFEDFWAARGVDQVNFNAEYFDTFRYRNLLATPQKRVDCDIQTYVLPSGKIAPCCAVMVHAHDNNVDWLPDIRTHTLAEAYTELCDLYDDPGSPLGKLCADCDWWIMYQRTPDGNSPYCRGVALQPPASSAP